MSNKEKQKVGGGNNQMKIHIEYQNQFGKWNHYQTKHNEADAYRVAKNRANQTGKRHRLVDESGSLLDLVEPD